MFELPPLPYAYDSLEPFIDKETMLIHHDKHHKTYTDKFNAALTEYPELQKMSAEEIIKNLSSVPEKIRTSVKNHGGGYINHSFFWTILKKDTKPKGKILQAIEKKFTSFENFKKQFSESATSLFGAGWTWLVLNNNELETLNLPNQESPLTLGKIPLLTIDLWEHAYYLKYQNKRADYIEAFFNVINWDKVEEIYSNALK